MTLMVADLFPLTSDELDELGHGLYLSGLGIDASEMKSAYQRATHAWLERLAKRRLMLMHPSNKVTLENVKSVVRYHRPNADQSRRHEALSAATEHFLVAILENCPDCADRSAAIRMAREAKMTASAAIALEEGHEAAVVETPKSESTSSVTAADGNADVASAAPPSNPPAPEPPPAPQPAPPSEPPPPSGTPPGPSFEVRRGDVPQ
jgi:hypothetical protein